MLPDDTGICSTTCVLQARALLTPSYAFIMFNTSAAAADFKAHLGAHGIACQYGKETPHLKQKALEDPHSSNLYVAEIPLDASPEVRATAVWR